MKVQKLLRFVFVNLTVVCCLILGGTGILASATVEPVEKTPEENHASGSNMGFVEYKFEDFCSGGSREITFPKDYATFLNDSESARYAQCFSGARAYSNWYSLAIKYVAHSGTDSVTFSAMPNWGENGYGTTDAAPEPGSADWQKGYARYQQVANKFIRVVTSSQISDVVRVAFDTESFNAQNAMLMTWTDTVADISNTVFTSGGTFLFYLIIMQGMLDIVYLWAPQFGFILARQSYSSQMGGNGNSRGSNDSIIGRITSTLPDFVSGAAADAVNQGASGRGNGGGTSAFGRFWAYVQNQWIFIVAICVTYVLWSTGLWPRLISFFGSLVASNLYQYI